MAELPKGVKMLVIRKEQMAIFQLEAERTFVDKVLEKVCTRYADTIRDVEIGILRKRVTHGIARAHEYGLTWMNNLTIFVMLMFDLGPEFDRYPAFNRCLTDVNLEPDERMKVLLKETTQDDWRCARQMPVQWPENCR
jgi:hypothetical protein